MDTHLLKTKLNIPIIRHGIVARPDLIKKLNAGLSRRLTLVSAPAGYGKSTLVSWWLAGQSHGAWLALDRGDNDLRAFWQYMIAALQTTAPQFGRDAQQHLRSQQNLNPQPILVSLLNEISESSQEVRLVLDDYHVIDSQEIHDSLRFFVENLPRGLHLTLLTRVDPPLSLGRLRANAELSEIRMADLRFNAHESADFLRKVMKIDLNPEQVQALNTRTEGWVAGLQMAGLTIQELGQPQDVASFLKDFTGSQRHIFDYLTDEVLIHQPQNVKDFLIKTSILERFNASLSEAVTGTNNTQTILDHLENSNLFLFPLDENRQWYRYHHLFATLLQRRLQQHADISPAALHQSAAEWHEMRRSIDPALMHLQAAGNTEGMIRLIKQHGVEFLRPAKIHNLQSWLDSLPGETVKQDAHLAGLQAWIFYFEQDTDQVEVWANRAQRVIEEAANDRQLDDPQLWGSILGLQSWSASQQGDFNRGVRLAQEALDVLPPNAHTWRGINQLLLAEALAGTGATAESIAAYQQSLPYHVEGRNLITGSAIVAAIWMTRMLRGQLNQAREEFERLIERITEADQAYSAVFPRLARVSILYEQNNLSEVLDELDDLWAIVQFDLTYTSIRYHYFKARYYTAVGDRESVWQPIQEMEDILDRWSAVDERARSMGEVIRIYLRLGDKRRPESWLQSVDYDINNLTLLHINEYISIADVLLSRNTPESRQEALNLLNGVHTICDEAELYGMKIEVYCLQALLLAAG
ncbi:MAG: hypothetical protein R3335_08540, partial [Anaerolineales bacterium]|nr:hypothetical protein [Anaerolineales bacterium]